MAFPEICGESSRGASVESELQAATTVRPAVAKRYVKNREASLAFKVDLAGDGYPRPSPRTCDAYGDVVVKRPQSSPLAAAAVNVAFDVPIRYLSWADRGHARYAAAPR